MREDRERIAALVIHPRARRLLPIFLVALVVLSWWRLSTPVIGPVAELGGATMGTRWSVKVHAPELDADARDDLDERVQGALDRVNALMSTYDPESELSRFNRAQAGEPFAISAETAQVFAVAREVSERSGGAFDVTVRPLVSAWGFGATDRAPIPPAPEELAALRARVGFALVSLDPAAPSLRKERSDVECDLSAIAKGFGVDQVAELLLAEGHGDFLVEVGGELRAAGLRAADRPWRVAIERPDPGGGRAIHRVVELRDRALATSGDYRNYFERDGRRFSHIIDPRSAAPALHPPASVTVVAERAVRADAWATALSVLGHEEGAALAEREGLAVYFLVRGDEGALRAIASPAFEALFLR